MTGSNSSTITKKLVEDYAHCLELLADARPIVNISYHVAVWGGLFIILSAILLVFAHIAPRSSLRNLLNKQTTPEEPINLNTGFPSQLSLLLMFMFSLGAALFTFPTIESWIRSFPMKTTEQNNDANSPIPNLRTVSLMMTYRAEAICNKLVDIDRLSTINDNLNAALHKATTYNQTLSKSADLSVKKAYQKAKNDLKSEKPLLGYSIPIIYFYTKNGRASKTANDIATLLKNKGASTKLIPTDFTELKNISPHGTIKIVFSHKANVPISDGPSSQTLENVVTKELKSRYQPITQGPQQKLFYGPIQIQVF